jgi:hypothetical protein
MAENSATAASTAAATVEADALVVVAAGDAGTLRTLRVASHVGSFMEAVETANSWNSSYTVVYRVESSIREDVQQLENAMELEALRKAKKDKFTKLGADMTVQPKDLLVIVGRPPAPSSTTGKRPHNFCLSIRRTFIAHVVPVLVLVQTTSTTGTVPPLSSRAACTLHHQPQ